MQVMAEWTGRTIGKVRIDQRLAHGGMAEVYLGTHLNLERQVAVKVLHSFIEEDQDLRERLQREAKVVAGFRHPNIVQVYDFDMIDGHPYIVMEYLNGPTLAVYLKELHARKARLSLDQVAQLLKGPAAALDYAHKLGVIHRDVKPGNIMLHGAGDFDAVVTDFGLMRMAGATHQTSIGTIAGTPNYMSPEQASGATTDFRTDIYSLGVVLYEMLAGRAPFDGESTLTVLYKHIHETPPPIPGVSVQIQDIITRALSKNPDDRFRSCGELAAAFEAVISQPSTRTVRPDVTETLATAPPPAVPSAPALASPVAMSPASAPPSAPSTNAVPATAPDSMNVSQEKPAQRRTGCAVLGGIAAVLAVALGAGAFLVLPRLGAAAGVGRQQETPSLPVTGASDVPTPAVEALPSSEGMVRIPAGDYQVGTNPPDEFHVAQQTVSLAEYWIDVYAVTNERYDAFVQETGAQAPQVWPAGAQQPVRGLTWEQANAYCSWMNKRLPTEAEWEAAGRGPSASPPLFPWGNDPTAGGEVLKMPDQDTYDVGSLAFNVSPSGVFDLVGNVWHWVGDAYSDTQPGLKILRGGRYGLPQDLAYRVVVSPDDSRYVKYAGFRCAAGEVK